MATDLPFSNHFILSVNAQNVFQSKPCFVKKKSVKFQSAMESITEMQIVHWLMQFL